MVLTKYTFDVRGLLILFINTPLLIQQQVVALTSISPLRAAIFVFKGSLTINDCVCFMLLYYLLNDSISALTLYDVLAM